MILVEPNCTQAAAVAAVERFGGSSAVVVDESAAAVAADKDAADDEYVAVDNVLEDGVGIAAIVVLVGFEDAAGTVEDPAGEHIPVAVDAADLRDELLGPRHEVLEGYLHEPDADHSHSES